MMEDAWLVLGGSSSVARAFAHEVARRGHDVLLAGRDLDDLNSTAADIRVRTGRQADAMHLDALAYGSHRAFAEACRQRSKRLSVFWAIGLMPSQQQIDREFDLARKTVEANYLGAVSLLSELAPVLEAQHGGAVVALGSVAGDRGRRKNYVYGSAKAALHAYLQGLRARLRKSGVQVLTVKLGFTDTAMTWGLADVILPAGPDKIARIVCEAIEKNRTVIYAPPYWSLIMRLLKLVPERLFIRLNI